MELLSFELRHLEATNLVPECECKHGRQGAGPLRPTGCGQWARPTDPKPTRAAPGTQVALRAGALSGQSQRSQSRGVPDGLWGQGLCHSEHHLVLRNCPAENQPHGRQRVPPAHSLPCSPRLESLPKLLGADSGWRLRLQAGRHPVPDCPGVQGDRQ